MKNVLINSTARYAAGTLSGNSLFSAHFPATLIDADTTATSEIFSKFPFSSQRKNNNPSRNFFVDTNVIALI